MLNFKAEENVLTIGNNKIEFNLPIEKAIEICERIIVLLRAPISNLVEDIPLNSLYAYDFQGNLSWNIKDIIEADNFYTIIREDNGLLVAGTFIGINYFIDVQNKIIVRRTGSRF